MFRFEILFLSWTLGLGTSFVTYALPSTSTIRPRDATPQVFSPNTTTDSKDIPLNSSKQHTSLAGIEAHIKDSNGVDITSSFQIRVFRQNATTYVTNLTGEDSGLHDRQAPMTKANVVRIMDDDCPSGEQFVESVCTPDYRKAPTRAYKYTCSRMENHMHALTGQYLGEWPTRKSRRRLCNTWELCVDGFGSQKIASCVHEDQFESTYTDKHGQVIGMLDGGVFDAKKMYLVMALQEDADPAVVIKARKMGMRISDSAANGKGGTTQSINCVNCVNLETDLLQPGLNSLKIEATLTAAAGVSGILWLAMG